MNKNMGLYCLIISLLLEYAVFFDILTHTYYIGGNWIDRYFILAIICFIVGIIFIFNSIKYKKVKEIIKTPRLIIEFILSLIIMFTLGEYLSQVGIPFIESIKY